MKSQTELKVYYDGLCKVCSKEIDHYKKQDGADRIEFIDICSDQFDAVKSELDPIQVHKIMHVRRKDGAVLTRVDAFIEIWKVLPKYKSFAKIANKPLIKFGLEASYSCFAVIRPYLPRSTSSADCGQSPYCETHFEEKGLK